MTSLKILTTTPSGSYSADRALARCNCLAVSNFCTRGYNYTCASYLCSPAEIKVFTEYWDERIKPAKCRKKVTTNQRHSTRSYEDVSLEILLAVVDFTHINAFLNDAKAVRGLAHVDQHHGVFVLNHLGGDNPRIRPKCSFHHHLDNIRLETNIVMAEQEEGGAINHQGCFIAGRTESLVFVKGAHESFRSYCGNSFSDVVMLPVRNDEQA